MINLKFITIVMVFSILLHGCSEILEPVSLSGSKQVFENQSAQEEFEIEIKSLNFKSAQDANSTPYRRWLMMAGLGSNANVIDEKKLLVSNMPIASEGMEYVLGTGDRLTYTQLNEFVKTAVQLPTQAREVDYLLGVGDELTLIQLNEAASGTSTTISGLSEADVKQNTDNSKLSENVLRTSSVVGTDGNILLLGLGSIEAENRSLKDVQTEVRNIMIRNGLAPNFQLEITGFNSKKAIIAYPNLQGAFGENIIPITNLPVTLKELAIAFGLRRSSDNSSIVSLSRDGQTFRMTAGQLFNNSSTRTIIKDGDQIEINEVGVGGKPVEVVVGSRGNILIPGVGSIKAKDRKLADVQSDIMRLISKKGLVPNFQLEISVFASKRFFLATNKNGSKTVPLDSLELDLKTALLRNSNDFNPSEGFYGTGSDEALTVIELNRQGQRYQTTIQNVLRHGGSKTFIQDGDIISLKQLSYKPGIVFTLSGTKKVKAVPINPSNRETLADILFSDSGALSNISAKRSEIYLLRGLRPTVAYHLDAQNVSRVLVAAKMELRPNDIVFVADRPIVAFSRVLREISPLQLLLRDANRGNLLE